MMIFRVFFQVRYVTRVDENDMIRNDSFSTRGATNEGGDGDSCQGAECVDVLDRNDRLMPQHMVCLHLEKRPHVGLTHSLLIRAGSAKHQYKKTNTWYDQMKSSTVRGIQIKQKKERLWRITHQKCPATYIPMVSWFCLTRGANFQEGRAHVMGGYDGGRCLEAQLGPSLKDWIWKISAQSQTIQGWCYLNRKCGDIESAKCFKVKLGYLGLSPLFFAGKKKQKWSFLHFDPMAKGGFDWPEAGKCVNGQWFHRFIDRREDQFPRW